MSKANIVNIGTRIDLRKLISSRLFVQAGSNGGKTTLLKKLAEKTNGKVQQIIIDYEGEYSSLREKFPYALIAKSGGEIAIEFKPNYIETLVHRILETRISVIIDLFDCRVEQRQEFTARFIAALMDAPKKYWHSIEIIIDEIQIGAPEDTNPESKKEIIDLATRGRKRGYFLIAAGLRVQDISKSVLAQCQNRIIGYNGMDIDIERAAKQIGLKREDYHLLQELEQGDFYAYGPAISRKVIKFTTGDLETSYTKAGEGVKVAPPTPDAIKKILSKLENLPEEAEKELKTTEEFKKKIREQTVEINRLKKIEVDPVKLNEKTEKIKESVQNSLHTEYKKEVVKVFKEIRTEVENYKKEYQERIKTFQHDTKLREKTFTELIMKYKTAFAKIGEFLDKLKEQGLELNLPEAADIKIPALELKMPELTKLTHGLIASKPHEITELKDAKVFKSPAKINVDAVMDDSELATLHKKIGTTDESGAYRMLCVLCKWYPKAISVSQMRVQADLKKSGTFTTYLSALNKAAFIEKDGDRVRATEAGMEYTGVEAADTPGTTEEVLAIWKPKLSEGACRMLDTLISHNGEPISYEDLASESNLGMSGTFTTYLSKLKTAELIFTNKQKQAWVNKENLFL